MDDVTVQIITAVGGVIVIIIVSKTIFWSMSRRNW